MKKLQVDVYALSEIVSDLSNKITHNHIANITVINSCDFFISFSSYRKEKLLVSLNPEHPFLSLITINDPCGTRVGNLSDTLRKEVKDGFLVSVELLNNDRVVCLTYLHTNDYFDKEDRRIIIELIPHRPNLILLDDDSKILFATHYTDLTNEHPILKGLIYKELVNNNTLQKSDFSLESFKEEATDYYLVAKHRRLEEQFKPVLQHIKSRIKTLKQKINVLHKEIDTATANLSYKDIGSTILAFSYDELSLKDYVKENNLEYDFSQTPGINANKYFKKYKKAKRTIEMDNIELEKTDNEIIYLQDCLAQSKYMNEDDIKELANLLFPNKFKLNPRQKLDAKPGEIKYKDWVIYFGKNAKQNDNLTFKKANKNDLFFHVKNQHGSHVILSGLNPDNDVKLLASEVALLLSGKEDGEVQMTLVKNIKKGSFLGQALFTSYESFMIRDIRKSTLKLLKNSK